MTILPRHLAIIMDGNSRWAKQKGVPIAAGHRQGVTSLRRTIKYCGELGIRIVTVFAFSSENWRRSKEEIEHLMQLFYETLQSTLSEFMTEGVALRVIGDRTRLDPDLVALIDSAEEATRGGKYTLVVALNYGGKQDIVAAAQQLAAQVQKGEIQPQDINLATFHARLALADLPPPDLCIRTSNEQRISNFMLWQLAYTELYFCDVLWPDFDTRHLDKALADFSRRQRRFGRRDSIPANTSENLSQQYAPENAIVDITRS